MFTMTMPAPAREAIETLNQNGHAAYLVGGCVRDSLRGVVPHDYDITTSARPEEVVAAFRGRTLLEVTKALIKLQEPFFRYGPRYTKLLPIQELAQALSMPEELVSATLKNKYLQSPFGVYPMKYFLAREHHPQQEGMEAIRQQLAQLIRGEHPDEPYTDEQLAQLMAKDGVFMTEELVERLREELNIPDSEHRIFYDPQSEEEHCCDDDCGHHHH